MDFASVFIFLAGIFILLVFDMSLKTTILLATILSIAIVLVERGTRKDHRKKQREEPTYWAVAEEIIEGQGSRKNYIRTAVRVWLSAGESIVLQKTTSYRPYCLNQKFEVYLNRAPDGQITGFVEADMVQNGWKTFDIMYIICPLMIVLCGFMFLSNSFSEAARQFENFKAYFAAVMVMIVSAAGFFSQVKLREKELIPVQARIERIITKSRGLGIDEVVTQHPLYSVVVNNQRYEYEGAQNTATPNDIGTLRTIYYDPTDMTFRDRYTKRSKLVLFATAGIFFWALGYLLTLGK